MNFALLLAQNGPAPGGEEAAFAAVLGIFCFVGFIILLSIGTLVFWIWAIIDVAKNPTLTDNERLTWILVVALLQVIGAIVYLLAGRKGTKYKGY